MQRNNSFPQLCLRHKYGISRSTTRLLLWGKHIATSSLMSGPSSWPRGPSSSLSLRSEMQRAVDENSFHWPYVSSSNLEQTPLSKSQSSPASDYISYQARLVSSRPRHALVSFSPTEISLGVPSQAKIRNKARQKRSPSTSLR